MWWEMKPLFILRNKVFAFFARVIFQFHTGEIWYLLNVSDVAQKCHLISKYIQTETLKSDRSWYNSEINSDIQSLHCWHVSLSSTQTVFAPHLAGWDLVTLVNTYSAQQSEG